MPQISIFCWLSGNVWPSSGGIPSCRMFNNRCLALVRYITRSVTLLTPIIVTDVNLAHHRHFGFLVGSFIFSCWAHNLLESIQSHSNRKNTHSLHFHFLCSLFKVREILTLLGRYMLLVWYIVVFNQWDVVLVVFRLGYDMAEGLPAFEPYRYRYYKNNAVILWCGTPAQRIPSTYLL